jgi:hypothetical protein
MSAMRITACHRVLATVAAVIVVTAVGLGVAGCTATEPARASGTPAPNWYDQTWGDFTPKSVTGRGDKIIDLPARGGIATFTSASSSYAVEELVTVDGKYVEAAELFNDQPDAGKQGGTSPWGLPASSGPHKLEIRATGDWTIVLAPFGKAPELTTAGASGTGFGVFRYDGPAGSWHTTYDGPVDQGWFNLMQHSSDNPDGNLSDGSSRFACPSIVVIQADGGWTSTKADWTIK